MNNTRTPVPKEPANSQKKKKKKKKKKRRREGREKTERKKKKQKKGNKSVVVCFSFLFLQCAVLLLFPFGFGVLRNMVRLPRLQGENRRDARPAHALKRSWRIGIKCIIRHGKATVFPNKSKQCCEGVFHPAFRDRKAVGRLPHHEVC